MTLSYGSEYGSSATNRKSKYNIVKTEINKFLEGIDKADLIDIKLTSPQKDSVAPPAKYAAMIIYEPKPKTDSKEPRA